MNNPNPASKDIDISTQEGLDLLKIKAKYYGHYAEQLKVLELIEKVEELYSLQSYIQELEDCGQLN